MNSISMTDLRELLSLRYRNARIYTLDRQYSIVGHKLIHKAYNQYVWQMRLIGLHRWVAHKMDCDKWSWLFKAYVIIRNALSKREFAIPIGTLCYHINGDRSKPHMINSYLHYDVDRDRLTIREIEPQPDNGEVNLTPKERETAWLVVY
jgi:hypothetical protein